jgi:hypothetical protein
MEAGGSVVSLSASFRGHRNRSGLIRLLRNGEAYGSYA